MARRCQTRAYDVNVPTFTIDLSLPPRDRYKVLAEAYKAQVQDVVPLFNGLLQDLGIDSNYHPAINKAARLILRGAYSSVETAELRGIRDVTNIPMYMLVAFNVVLDLLMGCTSGAVRSSQIDPSSSRMLHFRTLDWGMDPLRKLVVVLNFIRSQSQRPNETIAYSVTYVGYVGVLTGVRLNLSMSLNFRPLHNAQSRADQFRFYFHHVLVLLGLRPSISSILRSYLFTERGQDRVKDLATISQELTSKHTTAAYLTFSDGDSTITMEKDFRDAVTRHSSTFIAATNHDLDSKLPEGNTVTPAGEHVATTARMTGLQEMLDESQDRLDCISRKWKAVVKLQNRRLKTTTEDGVSIPELEVIKWVSAWPTTNEATHFAVVMDPKNNDIVWSHAYPQPVEEPVPRLSVN
jgi:hypothetical protein